MPYKLQHVHFVGLRGDRVVLDLPPNRIMDAAQALELAAYLVVMAEIAVSGKPADEALPAFADVLEAVRRT